MPPPGLGRLDRYGADRLGGLGGLGRLDLLDRLTGRPGGGAAKPGRSELADRLVRAVAPTARR